MLRRTALGILAAGAYSEVRGKQAGRLDQFLDSPRATAVLLDIPGRRLIAAGNPVLARRSLVPPGSTLKPFVLASLLENGRLKSTEAFPCPGRLRIGNRSFDCVHPAVAAPLTADVALAYSCNCFVAHVAARFEPGELARQLARFGLGSETGLFGSDEASGRIRATKSDEQRMQALGEYGVEVTPAALAAAYRLLALKLTQPGMEPIRKGLESAVEFGTAQKAGVPGQRIAGKTGSAMTPQGEPVAWFAGIFYSGILPSSEPKVSLAVMLPGRSGGSDAAPVARRILEGYQSGAL